jgi:hypothetical protein
LKKYFLLIIGCVLLASQFALSATNINLVELVDTTKTHRISFYSTSLKCTYSDKLDSRGNIFISGGSQKKQSVSMATIEFDILKDTEGKVGKIMMQWYPKTTPYRTSLQKEKILRLRHIEVGQDNPFGPPHRLQKHGHGTMAMETLLTILRQSNYFPEGTELWLECQTFKPYLSPWYEKFGFTNQPTPPALIEDGVRYLAVPLKSTKFPLHKKRIKAAKKIQAFWRGYQVRKKTPEN